MDPKSTLFSLLAETFASQAYLFFNEPPKTIKEKKQKEAQDEKIKNQHLKADSSLYSCLTVSEQIKEGNFI